uniref:Uncharacterized protein n=1 Tax=Bosea sp. NBC_00436 TaxID=2969620 RepID=A0A9E8CLF2_9HYPH
MSATVIPPKAAQAPDTRLDGKRLKRAAPRVVHVIGRCFLAALALVLAWLLASAEVTREDVTSCHRGYRDPVTGRQVERRC